MNYEAGLTKELLKDRCGLLRLGKLLYDVLDLRKVTAAENIKVDQEVIELPERHAVFKSRLQRKYFCIFFENLLRKSAKELHHRKIHLSRSITHGRIDEAGETFLIYDIIAAPQISVDQSRSFFGNFFGNVAVKV